MTGTNRSGLDTPGQHVRACIRGLTLRSKRWIEVDGRFAIGEGGGELLKAIEAEGSLTRGARRVGWSYRHAWGYVQRAEAVLGVPLLTTKSGKGAARGTLLTREAKVVIDLLGGASSGVA